MRSDDNKLTNAIELKYDGTFDISLGKSRKEIHWKNQQWTWGEFLTRISTTKQTDETAAGYARMPKKQQDEIKDVGGYVAGVLRGGKRNNKSVESRSALTLDLDSATPYFWDVFIVENSFAAAIYSTHKHTPENPRLRLIIPLDRPVTADEYEAIARKVAQWVGMGMFDPTTFEPWRLMYWPSTSKDAEYLFNYQDEPFLCADDVLAEYHDWTDVSEWPIHLEEKDKQSREAKKQGDPTEKPGLVGPFCKAYDVPMVIEAFLCDVYIPTADADRYTYTGGSTSGGLVLYQNGLFAYSHHSTDPASGDLCNAFDLVRVHKFGHLDEDAKPDTPINRMPSQLAMEELASNDRAVKRQIGEDHIKAAKEDFSGIAEADTEWMERLDVHKKGGGYKNTIDNVVIVLQNDPNLKGLYALDEFEQRSIATRNLPWRKITHKERYLKDSDDSGLRHYLEKVYNFTGVQRIDDALRKVIEDNKFHPVRDYLNSLKWDGSQRVETLFIDYLGAEDTPYTRAITRKALAAAVARVMNPGCKFDYIIVLIGPQGIGKSTILKKLGREWFSDSFTTFAGKEAYEIIQGVWILEMAELAGLKKAETEQIKHFISKTDDRYRVAYGKRTENFPRQCIFIGTTNASEFLTDDSGNRRFWPLRTMTKQPELNVFRDLSAELISQLWAEAVQMYKAGEELFLAPDLEQEAIKHQKAHRYEDDRKGIIQDYLDTLLPNDWDFMDLNQRRLFLQGDELSQREGSIPRETVSIAEIWCELFYKPQSEMNGYNTKPLHSIMKGMEGWEADNKGPIDVKHYGKQKLYRRSAMITIDREIVRISSKQSDATPF